MEGTAGPRKRQLVASGYRFEGRGPFGPPVLLRGSLHWIVRKRQKGPVRFKSFNTVTEVFGSMDLPVIREHMSLLEMDGELAMFCCGHQVITMVELWLLQDYKNQIWVCKHRVRLPAVKVSTFCLDWSWRMFFMSEEGVVIVTPEQKLLRYDMNGTLRQSFCIDGHQLKITPYTLKESLVRHAFFERQDNVDDREHDEPPPFFKGL